MGAARNPAVRVFWVVHRGALGRPLWLPRNPLWAFSARKRPEVLLRVTRAPAGIAPRGG
jgi:hypothetical protein